MRNFYISDPVENAILVVQTFDGFYEKRVVRSNRFEFTWPDLVDFFKLVDVREKKKDVTVVVCGTYTEYDSTLDEKRAARIDKVPLRSLPGGYIPGANSENFEAVSCVVVDIESSNGNDVDSTALKKIMAQTGLAYIAYTTHSHRRNGKGNRFRVVVPFSTPCPKAKFRELREAFTSLFSGVPFDPTTFDCGRVFAKHSCDKNNETFAEAWSDDGGWLDWTKLIVTAKPQAVKTESTISVFPNMHHANMPKEITSKRFGTMSVPDLCAAMSAAGINRLHEVYDPTREDHHPCCVAYLNARSLVVSGVRTKSGMLVIPKFAGLTKLWARTKLPNSPHSQASSPQAEPIYRFKSRYLGDSPVFNLGLPEDATRSIKEHVRCHKDLPQYMFIRSPKGTGKTEVLVEITGAAKKEGHTVLNLGHRITLLRGLSERLGTTHYQDSEEVENLFSLCVNSADRIDVNDKPPTWLIIDECEQFFSHIVGKTLNGSRRAVFSKLVWLLRYSKHVILADADLSESTIDTIIDLCDARKIIVHPRDPITGRETIGLEEKRKLITFSANINEYCVNDKLIHMYDSRDHLMTEALDLLHAGKRVFIATNWKEFAEIFDAAVTLDIPNCKKLLVTSTTVDGSEQRAFVSKPSHTALNYDLIVASPTLSTGISIDTIKNQPDPFDAVFGFFISTHFTQFDCDQAISRVRNCSDVRVWIERRRTQRPMTPEERIDAERSLARKSNHLCEYTQSGTVVDEFEEKYVRFYARWGFYIDDNTFNKAEKFIALKEDNGFQVVRVEKDDDKANQGGVVYSVGKKNIPSAAAKIFGAKIICEAEFEVLREKKRKSNDEYNSFMRYVYARHFGHKFSLEKLEEAIRQDLLCKLEKVRRGRASLKQLANEDNREKKKSADFGPHFGRKRIDREIFDALVSGVGISQEDVIKRAQKNNLRKKMLDICLHLIASGDEISYEEVLKTHTYKKAVKEYKNRSSLLEVQVTDDMVRTFGKSLANQLNVVNALYKKRIKNTRDISVLVPIWNDVLGPWGIKLKSIRKMVNGVSERRRIVDLDDIELLAEVLNR
jgi:hypothetical protein